MGYIIDESRTATHYTPAAQVPQVFGGPRDIQSITIHHWGALGQRGPDILDWFCSPTTKAQTSAHFVVWDGNVYCIVSPPDAAWHAGNGEGNRTSIGIECHPEATDGDYATVAWLVSWLRSQYGDIPLHPHNFWTSTTCPGAWDLARLDALARGTTPQSGTTTPLEDDMGTLENITDTAMANLAKMVHDQVIQANKDSGLAKDVDDILGSVAWQEGFIAQNLPAILAKAPDPAAIAAAIPAGIAKDVADELGKRLNPAAPAA